MVVQVRESARAAEEEEEVGFRSRPVSLFFFYFPSPLKKDQQQLQERLHLTTISTGACDEKISDSCRNQFFVVNWPQKF